MSETKKANHIQHEQSTYNNLFQYLSIGKEAGRQALEENRKLGIPNVYSMNGKIFYELPDGTITDVQPEIYQQDFSRFGVHQ